MFKIFWSTIICKLISNVYTYIIIYKYMNELKQSYYNHYKVMLLFSFLILLLSVAQTLSIM